MVKVIQIEPFIKKREALVIEEYSRKGDIERLNKVILRRMWREQRYTQVGSCPQ